ncbi:MAG: FprA family A-type flavoprotein [Candidatus Brocadiia bacterium]
MNAIRITEGIHWVGVNDRETDLFEAIWPIPDGIAYNAYVVDDERVAVVDTVKASGFGSFLSNLRTAIGPDRDVDYLIINHIEPDHSGSARLMREVFPDVTIVGNRMTLEFLSHLYGIDENVLQVSDGDELELGERTLQFLLAPMVHWPETMVTWDPADRVLFSGDAFGAFGALDGAIFDDQLDVDRLEEEILRYFANIIGKFCTPVQKAIERVRGLDLSVVASTHGPVWRDDPWRIVDCYDRLARQETEPEVVVVYGSMYGNTTAMMEAVCSGLREGGCPTVRVHDASRSHVSYILRDAWRAAGLIIGTATYDQKIFPPIEHLVNYLEAKRLVGRALGLFGTYGWSGGGVEGLEEFGERCNFDLVEPVVEARFMAKDDDLKECVELGRAMADRVAPQQ